MRKIIATEIVIRTTFLQVVLWILGFFIMFGGSYIKMSNDITEKLAIYTENNNKEHTLFYRQIGFLFGKFGSNPYMFTDNNERVQKIKQNEKNDNATR